MREEDDRGEDYIAMAFEEVYLGYFGHYSYEDEKPDDMSEYEWNKEVDRRINLVRKEIGLDG